MSAVEKAAHAPDDCRDFHHPGIRSGTDPCGGGIGLGVSGLDNQYQFSQDFEAAAVEQNLTGDEFALYVAKAKVQDLKRMYLGLVQYCQEKFASDVDLCKGYALKMVLGAREIAYYSDLNPNVYPANDEEFLTADFKGFYNELSSKTQKKIEGPDDIGVTIYGRLLTADEIRAEKKQHVEKILQQFYQTSAPTGVSDPELEPLVIAYFQKLNPDLKIKTVVFNER